MFQKIVKKSAVWWRHGKHKGMAQELARQTREQVGKRKQAEMFGSIRELFGRRSAR